MEDTILNQFTQDASEAINEMNREFARIHWEVHDREIREEAYKEGRREARREFLQKLRNIKENDKDIWNDLIVANGKEEAFEKLMAEVEAEVV